MEVVITREHLRSAKAAGACRERLSRYKAGTELVDVAREDLVWVEEKLPELASEVAADLSRDAGLLMGSLRLSDFGYGYGSGYGDGSDVVASD